MTKLRYLLVSQRGTSSTEYAVIVVGIALAACLGLRAVNTVRQVLGTTASAVHTDGPSVHVEDTETDR